MKNAPHSFVIKRGLIGKNVHRLMMDMRAVLEPNTASQLKVRKTNVIKDFVSIASIFHVTHMMLFTKTEKNIFMRLGRVPHGPTMIFRVHRYTLGKDVRTSLRRPMMNQKLFRRSPLLVMNAFDTDQKPHLKLVTTLFKTLFPTIDVNRVKLGVLKRCVLLNYDSEKDLIEFRQFAIKIKPVGLSKPVKKLITSKRIPNLSGLRSFDDIMDQDHGFTSESEGELDEVEDQRHVELPQPIRSRGNMLHEKSAIRCVEIGPRLTLELIKVQEGLCSGDILYSKFNEYTKGFDADFDLDQIDQNDEFDQLEEDKDSNDEGNEALDSDEEMNDEDIKDYDDDNNDNEISS